MDKKPGPMGAEAEPEDERDEPNNGEEAQEDGADYLRDPCGEAVLDPMDVVTGGVMAFHGLRVRVRTRDVVNGYVVVAVHFALWDYGR